MRTFLFGLILAACGNSPDPHMIAGGGVGDGAIDGTVNVYVIDSDTYEPIRDATVEIGSRDAQTDSTGLVVLGDVSGPQTVAVNATGYRGVVWQDVNGANLTIPVQKLGNLTAQQATLTGTVAAWDTVTVPAGHAKAAIVGYSQTDDFGDPANNLVTPSSGNVCFGNPSVCNFSIVTRTGAVTLTAAVVDIDPHGNLDPADDTYTIIGWATGPSVQVNAGVNQTGLVLTQLDAGKLQTVTIDYGTPPDALPQRASIVGIEISSDEVLQLPVYPLGATSALIPALDSFPGATYRLTAVAQTTATDGPTSVVIQRGQTAATLMAAKWLTTPVDVSATRTSASLSAVAGAKLHSVEYSDATGILLTITMFDAKKLATTVPALVALPADGELTVKAQGIGADIDLQNFSLDTDEPLLWGAATQPATID
ncbi:MAG TPA: hypothetical protein VGC41_03110 [Kofleriaceae bacterium]